MIRSGWEVLDGQFAAMRDDLRNARLDYQWGDAGSTYNFSGPIQSGDVERFKILAERAGGFLVSMSAGAVDPSLLAVTGDRERWYEALRLYSESFRTGFAAEHRRDDKLVGMIYTGFLPDPAPASSRLCLLLSGMPEPPAEPNPSLLHRLRAWVDFQAEHYRRLWLTAGVLLGLLLTALAL